LHPYVCKHFSGFDVSIVGVAHDHAGCLLDYWNLLEAAAAEATEAAEAAVEATEAAEAAAALQLNLCICYKHLKSSCSNADNAFVLQHLPDSFPQLLLRPFSLKRKV
jgi:hypothetical protein